MNSEFSQRGGWWIIGQFLLMLAIAVLGITHRTVSMSPAIFISGLVLLTASVVCCFAGLLALGQNLTPFPKPSATARFVHHGIYSLIRHPLYTSVFCAALGWSFISCSWTALVISLVLGVFLDAKSRREERWLREQFSDYASYEQRVRRFIPWIY